MKLRKAGLAVFWTLWAAFIAIQFVPVHRHNPAVTAPLSTDTEVENVLREACFDCHSNETVWPWYSHVAPVSWLVAKDVEEGRMRLNFSDWQAYSAASQADLATEIAEDVEEAEMPLKQYLITHPEARLDEASRKIIVEWADSLRKQSQLSSAQ